MIRPVPTALGPRFYARLKTPVALELGVENALAAAGRACLRSGRRRRRQLRRVGGEAGGELASRAACGAMAMDLDRLRPLHDAEARRD